ncbi:MAG TPA: hypothetical protein VEQ63_14475 [Bryobacteraceae bacterium]|nr:hypothetical protein [Bryobacteraceae bacterium]
MTYFGLTIRLGLLAFVPGVVFGQSEAALRKAFEGKRVVVNIEMPATKWGIDVDVNSDAPIDFRLYSQRIKEFGTALRPGDSVLVTGIKVKEKLIEFHLAGGGYGTLFDDTSADIYVPSSEKTTREKNLEKAMKYETDSYARRKMKEELSDLRSERSRDDRLAQAVAAQASEAKREHIRRKALDGGSRFNLRYAKGQLQQTIPTPEMIVEALSQWIDFGPAYGDRRLSATQ